MTLSKIIAAEIRDRGPIPFDRFAELALYHPELGYYQTARRVGREGDFYTSVSVSPLFGALIARQCALWLRICGEGSRILECGANDGQLAADVLTELRAVAPDLVPSYTILEPSAKLQNAQKSRLKEFGAQIEWRETWREVGPFRGVIVSNELLDAMPVNVWRWSAVNREWCEMGVEIRGESFQWAPLKITRHSLEWLQIPDELMAALPDGFTVEEGRQATSWWSEATRCLDVGFLLAFDYGLEADEFLMPHRAAGTLRSYSGHRFADDVLANPGEQDITAHVNFSALREAGEQGGLRTEFSGSQSLFLTRIAADWMKSAPADWTSKRARQLQTLTHPEHLGRSFRALLQRRDPAAPRNAPLPHRAMLG